MCSLGNYSKTSEGVSEAVRLLQRIEQQRVKRVECLRTLIRVGDEAIANGKMIVLNSNQELDEFFAKL